MVLQAIFSGNSGKKKIYSLNRSQNWIERGLRDARPLDPPLLLLICHNKICRKKQNITTIWTIWQSIVHRYLRYKGLKVVTFLWFAVLSHLCAVVTTSCLLSTCKQIVDKQKVHVYWDCLTRVPSCLLYGGWLELPDSLMLYMEHENGRVFLNKCCSINSIRLNVF